MLCRLLTFAFAATAAATSSSEAHAQVRAVAVSNFAAPGAESGALVYQFSQSGIAAQLSLDNAGRSAFLGRMIGGFGGVTSATDTGIWSEGSGSLQLVAREASQAPGIVAGGVFAELNREPILNDLGRVAFPASLRAGVGGVAAGNDSGIWAQRNGSLELVVREGAQAPGAPAATAFSSFTANSYPEGFFVFNNLGQTAFTASLAVGSGGVTATNDTGIWAETTDGLALIAREGASAPGTGAGAVFDDLTGPSESPVLNNRGQLAFTAQLRIGPGGVTIGNDFGIWSADDGVVTLAIREGGSAPVPTGGVFRHFGELQINDAGNLLFRGLLNPGPSGVTDANDDAIWLRRNGAIELVAREGTQVPGAPAGANYGAFSYAAFNNHNRVALSGYLQNGSGGVTIDNNAALWSGTAENARLIARENDLAPGALGAVFHDPFFPPNINTAGQIAFMASLKPSGGVTADNDRGIWATDVHGVLHLIAREGDLLEVAPGDVRTISQLGFRSNTGNADGRNSMFNDFGQVQFWAELGGSEGVFVSDLVKRDPSPTDFDENGVVDSADLAAWTSGFGKSGTVTQLDGDADNDQDVDGRDFLAWQRQLGGAGAAATVAAVPEPSAALLLIVASLIVAAPRTKRTDCRILAERLTEGHQTPSYALSRKGGRGSCRAGSGYTAHGSAGASPSQFRRVNVAYGQDANGAVAMPPRSSYIHIPFCLYRCGYCDFAIVTGRDDLVEPYLQALRTELSWLDRPRPVETLYFGGGTPSYLESHRLAELCEIVLTWHPLLPWHEWTVEANPESLTVDRVEVLAEHGVTRLSLGVQSLDDAKLQTLDRQHRREDVVRSMQMARDAGLQVSIDLIFAAPGETLELWRRDLQDALALSPDHLSTYGLTWETGTAFTTRRSKGEFHALDEELERAMYGEAIDTLTAAGFEHYEVSNFARPGRRSRHNEVYWAGKEYFAAGPGAARYVGGVRETNHRSTTTYLKRILSGESPVADREQLSAEQRARELLVLGLRRLEGVERSEFEAATGYDLDELAGETIARFVELGLLTDDGSRVKLTREGLFVSDALWPDLL